MIDVTDTPHGLHLDTDGGTPVTLSSDAVTAIVQHELGKLGLWWAKQQRALVTTTPDNDGYFLVLDLDNLADGPCWCAPSEAQTGSDPVARALAAYLATLPAEPKPGETWELTSPDPKVDPWRATVVVIDGLSCLAWRNDAGPHICPLGAYGPRMRRKIADAPSGADQ